MSDHSYAIHCPICGRQLCKSGEGTNTEITCDKCGGLLEYTVENSCVRTSVIQWSPKEKKKKTA